MTAKEWNDKYSKGQPVHLTEDDGSITETKTRSVAWDLGHKKTVVMVEGKSGGYSLERITAK